MAELIPRSVSQLDVQSTRCDVLCFSWGVCGVHSSPLWIPHSSHPSDITFEIKTAVQLNLIKSIQSHHITSHHWVPLEMGLLRYHTTWRPTICQYARVRAQRGSWTCTFHHYPLYYHDSCTFASITEVASLPVQFLNWCLKRTNMVTSLCSLISYSTFHRALLQTHHTMLYHLQYHPTPPLYTHSAERGQLLPSHPWQVPNNPPNTVPSQCNSFPASRHRLTYSLNRTKEKNWNANPHKINIFLNDQERSIYLLDSRLYNTNLHRFPSFSFPLLRGNLL